MRTSSVLPTCLLLLLPLLATPGRGVTQGNGFRWFWRGSTGGSTTHKFSFQSRGGRATGSHSMVVVRVKDSAGRTVLLDPANPQVTRSVVHGFSGKGANKSTFTVTKTIGGISSAHDAIASKPSKHMQPPPPPPHAKATSPSIVKKIVPAAWFVQSTSTTPKPVASYLPPQVSSKLLLSHLTATTQKPRGAYLPPPQSPPPQGNGIVGGTSPGAVKRPPLQSFIRPPPKSIVDVTGPSGATPTPTPASHVGRDIRRNLSGRVDGSVFFGILPVVNDLQRNQVTKPKPSPKVVISRRPGKCPFVDMTRCPAVSGGRHSSCSNDNQCPREQRCCYNPCAANSMCMAVVL